MHPWHDTYVDDTHVEKAFTVIAETLELYRRMRRGEVLKRK
jgi:hypothetical protein